MKFKKILISGFKEAEIEPDFWNRIKSVSESVVFSTNVDAELIPELSDVDCLCVKFNGVSKEMINSAPDLKYIGVFGTGYGKVDVDHAKSKEIIVTNVPGYSTESVAELVFAIILENFRDLERAKKQARCGDYSEDTFTAREIKDKTVGILGLGQIGLRTAEIALGFGADVKYWSRSKKDVNDKIPYADFEEVISTSDILSIHLPLSDETEGLFNSENINKIKKGALVINTSPMEIVVIDALADRLEKADITFALDHSDEMGKEDLDKVSKYENCLIYPPIGYISDEAGIAKQEIFVANIEGFTSESPVNNVN